MERDPTDLFNPLTGACSQVRTDLMSQVASDGTRRNGLKLHQRRSRPGFWENFFMERLSNIGIGCPEQEWNHLPEAFKNHMDVTLGDTV